MVPESPSQWRQQMIATKTKALYNTLENYSHGKLLHNNNLPVIEYYA